MSRGHKQRPAQRPAPAAPSPTAGTTRTRFLIEGDLIVVSPLHVGTGQTATKPGITGKDGTPLPEVAELLRDGNNRPFLPGTTLKGVLRRTAEGMRPTPNCVALFGEIRDADSGAMGALIVRGAAEAKAGNAAGMPYAKDGVFVAARTRIDRNAGTAAASALHFAEMVAPDARFRLRLLLDPRDPKQADPLMRDLIRVMSRLCISEGVAIGRGQADGLGRVRLDPSSMQIGRCTLSNNGEFTNQKAAELWQKHREMGPPGGGPVTLVLTCADPFAILDSSHVPKKDSAGNPEGAQLRAQTRGGKALLLGSSLTGVLRSRAAWLEMLKRHREKNPATCSAEVDDPKQILNPHEPAGKLTPIERLFGVNGFRGLAEIRTIEVTKGTVQTLTSVKLDRFSGAPIDNALFGTEAFIGTEIKITLALAPRASQTVAADDRALWEKLLDDIVKNGIVLGHGGNKGFGWFSVKRG